MTAKKYTGPADYYIKRDRPRMDFRNYTDDELRNYITVAPNNIEALREAATRFCSGRIAG